jgi:hypothetical protein
MLCFPGTKSISKDLIRAGLMLMMGSALLFSTPGLYAQTSFLSIDKKAIIFSAVKGSHSQPANLPFDWKTGRSIRLRITGGAADKFTLVSPGRQYGRHYIRAVVFSPDSNFIGVARANLEMTGPSGKLIRKIELRGLALQGLEGANEPALATVFEALGCQIDPGWQGLPHDLGPETHGDELATGSFRAAGKGNVEIRAVARFSPDYALPFGYYVHASGEPQYHQIGVLAKTIDIPQHQTLFPAMVSGTRTFDPGPAIFGLYTTSPTHTTYSEDDWNLLLAPGHAGHATRIYPVKDQNGNPIPNTYIVCFEEAQNGDYQDYVFMISNVKPVNAETAYSSLMNGRDLSGWHIFLKDKIPGEDPEHNFSVEDGAVHVRGRDLGYIRTEKGFTGYHFKVEFKWGEKRWPPRENAKRDGGICYNIPMDEPDSIWPRSIECQIQEGDVGDFWLLSFSTIEVDGQTSHPSNHTRIVKKKDAEKPNGNWNTVEVISWHGRCIQIVNGVVVNEGDHASIKDGRILLQSEFSEIVYKNARISML